MNWFSSSSAHKHGLSDGYTWHQLVMPLFWHYADNLSRNNVREVIVLCHRLLKDSSELWLQVGADYVLSHHGRGQQNLCLAMCIFKWTSQVRHEIINVTTGKVVVTEAPPKSSCLPKTPRLGDHQGKKILNSYNTRTCSNRRSTVFMYEPCKDPNSHIFQPSATICTIHVKCYEYG